MKEKNWYKPKAYTHFTRKLSMSDTSWVANYVSDSEKISKHCFFPLIHRTIVAKRYKEVGKDDNDKPIRKHYTINNGIRKTTAKFREIYYANHLDSHVYAYYTQKVLEPLYEDELKSNIELNKSILAYRRIELLNEDRCKCSIDFASETFDEIKNFTGEVSVLALDISKFFDSLDHKILKKAWANLLGRKDLEKDHYNIYKSLIQFSYVEMNDILREYGYKHPNQLKQNEVSHILENGEEFRKRIKEKNYIKSNPFRNIDMKVIGIPQGTPMSAFLANLYLLEFDKEVLEIIKPYVGIYRRYSDDLLIICPKENHQIIENEIYELIQKKFNLIIQPTKTQRVFFNNGRLVGNKPVEYLGFQYDGNKKLLKSASIAKFYRKMKKSVKFKAVRALVARKKVARGIKVDTKLHRNKLYKQFSFLGAKKTKKKERSFFSYAFFAAKIMKSPHIKLQLSNAWNILHKEIHKYEKRYKLPIKTMNNKQDV